MSYYEPYDEPFDTGEMDPYAMDDQAMVDFLVANGVGTGLLPQVQPSGKPMTVSNIAGALSSNRQGLFDTAFQGGMGGADAFAPDAFVPTVTTTIRQEPELQQVYGYLRSPTSMEGIITQELMLGGTPATAQRALRQMLTATPEEMEAIFARYDEFFDRAPSMSAADAESIKTNLLLELPPARDEFGNPTEITPEGEGVDWNNSEDMSVFARANMINELNAQIPRIGPSGPKWGTDPTTGQPMQISAGGELQWGTDESGAPVMIEVTETPSAAKTVFDKLGLPDPSEEYTAEDFMTPDQIAMQQAYGETEDPVAQLKAAWMDPSLAPSNQGAGGPAAQLANGKPYVPGAGAPPQPPYNVLGTTTNQLVAVPPGQGLPRTTVDAAVDYAGPTIADAYRIQDPTEFLEWYNSNGNLLDDAQRFELISWASDQGVTGPDPNISAQWSDVTNQINSDLVETTSSGSPAATIGAALNAPYTPTTSQELVTEAYRIQNPDEFETFITANVGQIDPSELMTLGAHANDQGWTDFGGRLMRGEVAAAPSTTTGGIQFQLGSNPKLPPGGGKGTRPNVLVPNRNQPPPTPPGGGGITFQLVDANGNPVPAGTPRGPGMQIVAVPAASPTTAPTSSQPSQPVFGDNPLADALQGIIQAGQPSAPTPQMTNAMLSQILGGGQQIPGYQQGAGQPARQPGDPGTQQPSQPVFGNNPLADALQNFIQAGQQVPGYQQGAGQPARQPGGPGFQQEPGYQQGAGQTPRLPGGASYLQAVDTGEQRAAQRQEDEQQAQILGGSTDRTGKRRRPTRTGEQARQYRAAFDAWDQATDEQFRMRQAAHTYESGQAMGQAWKLQAQGIRPIDQAMMARRLVMMNAGMPQGI